MTTPDWRAFSASAAHQHQLVNLTQARSSGVSKWAVRRMVASGRATRPQRGVAALAGSEDSAYRRAKAVELAVGAPVRITGLMAVYLWGLGPAPEEVDAVVPRRRAAPVRPAVRGRRLTVWQDEDRDERHGVEVTAVPLTLLLLAADLPGRRLRALLMDAVQRRLCTYVGVTACCDRHRNVSGARVLRRLAWELDASRADSVLEDETRRRLVADGFVPDAGQLAVAVEDSSPLHVDIPFAARLVGLECDGMTHATRSGLTLDALRHNAYAETNWVVLRVTWDVLDDHWDEFTARLGRLLDRRGAPRLGDVPLV